MPIFILCNLDSLAMTPMAVAHSAPPPIPHPVISTTPYYPHAVMPPYAAPGNAVNSCLKFVCLWCVCEYLIVHTLTDLYIYIDCRFLSQSCPYASTCPSTDDCVPPRILQKQSLLWLHRWLLFMHMVSLKKIKTRLSLCLIFVFLYHYYYCYFYYC